MLTFTYENSNSYRLPMDQSKISTRLSFSFYVGQNHSLSTGDVLLKVTLRVVDFFARCAPFLECPSAFTVLEKMQYGLPNT